MNTYKNEYLIKDFVKSSIGQIGVEVVWAKLPRKWFSSNRIAKNENGKIGVREIRNGKCLAYYFDGMNFTVLCNDGIVRQLNKYEFNKI